MPSICLNAAAPPIPWVFNLGGSIVADDESGCMERALAIVTGVRRSVVDAACERLHPELFGEPRQYSGVHLATARTFLERHGRWTWHQLAEWCEPRCRAHLNRLPSTGRLLAVFQPSGDWHHATAVLDGVAHDLSPPNGCLFGFFRQEH